MTNAKKNWVKGLDRIAILLAIPIAIFGFFFTYNQYIKNNFKYKFEKSLETGYSRKEIYNYIRIKSVYSNRILQYEKAGYSINQIMDFLENEDQEENHGVESSF